MKFTTLWFLRGGGIWLFVPMAGFGVLTAVMNHPWHLEFDWGVRYMAGSVFVFAPLIAAVTAFDVARRARPALYDVALGASRGAWAVLSPAVAVLGWSLLASCASWLTIAAIVAQSDGLGPSSYWVFAETLAACAAAASLGALMGTYLDGLVAVAASAGVVLLAVLLIGDHDVSVFQVAGSSGTMLGLERTPARAILAIACNICIVAACVLLVVVRIRAFRRARLWDIGAALLAVAGLVMSGLWPYVYDEYRFSSSEMACAGERVVVCGPARGLQFWRRAAGDLETARKKLEGSGLELPTRFAVVRGDRLRDLPEGTSLLDYDTAALVNGHLNRRSIAYTLATPRICAAFFSDTNARPYLDLVDITSSWLLTELADSSGAEAPPAVRAAYQELATCSVRR